MIESLINWFGVATGLLGVTLAVYLQLINPRRCNHANVGALFAAGSALIMLFSQVWVGDPIHAAVLKVFGIVTFAGLEVSVAYHIWKTGVIAGPVEAVHSLFNNDDNGA